jgi:hypothetical protein
MRILCFHGRGSNTQVGGFRSHLPMYLDGILLINVDRFFNYKLVCTLLSSQCYLFASAYKHLSTAAIRADLEDFDFEFIQGTVRHTEGTLRASNTNLCRKLLTILTP